MKNFFSLIITIFIFSCTNAQHPKKHTDIEEYSLKGKVKTMSIFKYYGSNVESKDSIYLLVNHDLFESKRTYFFNLKGDIDSIKTYIPYPNDVTKEIIPIYNYSIYEFDKEGNKSGFKFLNGERKLEQIGEIKWLDEFHYVQINYGFDKGGKKTKIEEIEFTLTTDFKEESYEVKTFGVNTGDVLSHYLVISTYDKLGYLQKKRVEYKGRDKEWDEDKYKHQKFDGIGNPIETIRLNGYNNKPNTFLATNYTYYK